MTEIKKSAVANSNAVAKSNDGAEASNHQASREDWRQHLARRHEAAATAELAAEPFNVENSKQAAAESKRPRVGRT